MAENTLAGSSNGAITVRGLVSAVINRETSNVQWSPGQPPAQSGSKI